MTPERPEAGMIGNVCHDCGGVLDSPTEFGHDDLLCTRDLAVTLYRRYCRACRSYWLHLGIDRESDEGRAQERLAAEAIVE